MLQPLISVIMPVYNVEKFLPDCLESLLNQTYRDIEIICVNDGSSDNSPEVLNAYAQKDKRIVVINKVNGGAASARNLGLSKAQGEYVFFMDSDDRMSPECLQSLVDELRQNKVDMACLNDICSFYSNGRIEKQQMLVSFSTGVHEISDKLIQMLWVVPWGKLYYRQTLLDWKLKFPEGYIYEDEFFHHALLPHMKKIVVSSRGTYFYRQWENSVMSSKKLRSGRDNLYIFQKIYEYFEQEGWLNKISLPARILTSGFKNNANPQSYYQEVKNLLEKDAILYEQAVPNKLVKALFDSRDYQEYCQKEKRLQWQEKLKIFRKHLFRCKIGRKTHIAVCDWVLFHKAKGEQSVLFGIKCPFGE